jgi:MFS family permease
MTESAERATGLDEWRAGWIVVLVASLGVGVSQIHYLSLGFMMRPIEQSTGWSRGDISAATLIFSILLAIASPIAGRMVDRGKERRIGIPAMIAYCLLLASLSQVGTNILLWWTIWAGIAAVSPFASLLFWTTVVARRFDRQRALALAFTLSGSGIGMTFMPIMTHYLVQAYGWRGAYLTFGLVGGALAIPLAYLILDRPSRYGAAARGGAPAKLPWRELIRSPAFLKLTFAGTVMSMMSATLAVHFVPMQLHRGISAEIAAAATGLIGIGAILGRIVIGILLDRSKGPLVGALTYALPVLPCILLLFIGPVPVLAFVIGFLFGLSSGSETDVLSYFISRYFGVARYGAVFGACFAVVGAAAGIGPWLAGLVYDATGAYTIVFGTLMPLAILAAIALATLGRYPPESSLEGSGV